MLHGLNIGLGFRPQGVGLQAAIDLLHGLLWHGRQQAGAGVSGLAAPVTIKVAANIGHHGADSDHIKVGKQHAIRGGKVLVANIAAPDDGGLVICRKALVVHAPLGARELCDIAQHLGRAHGKGVEQAHFNVRVLIQRGQRGIHAGGAAVVQQQTHAHAAVGGLQQFIEQQVTRGVVAPDVVLHIQRVLCRAGQQGAGGVGGIGIAKRVNATQLGVRLLQRSQRLTEP